MKTFIDSRFSSFVFRKTNNQQPIIPTLRSEPSANNQQLLSPLSSILIVFLLLITSMGWGQVTILSTQAGGGALPAGWTGTNNVTANAIDRTTYWLVESSSSTTKDFITTGNLDLSAYSSITINVNVATFGGTTTNQRLRVELSTNGGSTYPTSLNSAQPTSSDSYIAGGPITFNGPFTSTTRLRFSNLATSLGIRIQQLGITGILSNNNIWDANGAITGSGNAGGNWSESKWTSSSNGTLATAAYTNGRTPTFSAGTDGTGTFTIAVDAVVNANGISFEEGNVTLGASTGTLTLTGATVTVASGATGIITEPVLGSVGLTKAGAGLLTLTGSNTFTGNINITAGTLIASGSVPSILNNRPIDISSGATLRFSANSDFQQPNQTITGAGTIEQNGLRISTVGNINAHTGDLVINSGDYDSRTGQAIGNTSRVIINSPGKLTIVVTGDETVGTVEGNGELNFYGAGTPRLYLSGNTDRTFSGTITGGGQSSATDAVTGTGVLIKNGTGALTLSGSNSFTGGISLNNGRINIGNISALGNSRFFIGDNTNSVVLDNTTGGTLNELTYNPAMTWKGNFTFAGTHSLTTLGTVTLANNPTVTVSANTLTVSGIMSGSSSLTKAGAGTLALRGDNTFTGGLTVSAGTLLATGSAGTSNTGTGAVSVNSGATLGGTYRIGYVSTGNVTVNTGGIIAPGTGSSSTFGNLRTLGNLTLNGTYQCEYNSSNVDQLQVDGTLTLSGATLDLSGSNISPRVIATYGTLSGTFTTINNMPAGYTLDYNFNGLNQIALVVITSPTVNANPGTLSGALTTTYGTASASQSFTVSGSSLTNNLVVTAPAGLEVSTDNTNFSSFVSLTPSSGTVNNTTIYVRIAATAAVGSYNSLSIAITSTGATPVNVSTTSSGNTVSAKELTITGLSGNNKVYDRTTSATATGTAVLNGVVGSENVVLGGSPIFTFVSANVANGISITVSGYTISGAAAGNYTLTQPAGLTGNITPKELTVSNAAVTTKSYDGNTQATITGTTLNGVISPDVVTISNLGISGSGTFASANPGTGIAVTANLTLGGADAGNYSITQPTGLTGTITPVTQNGDNFRSKQTGNWNAVSTWESETFGNWVDATTTPTATNAGTITIRANHTVTVTAGVSVDQVTIDALGQITVNASQTLTVENGTGVDLIINGTYLNQGTISTTGTWQINSGGTFIHNATTGITTPMNSGTFNNGSTFIFRNVGTSVSISGRTFGNLRFETSSVSITTTPGGTNGVTINNDLYVGSNVTLALTNFSGTTIIGGNVTIDGILTLDTDAPGVAGNWTNNGTFNAGTSTVTLNGSLDQSISGSSTFTNLTISKSSGAVNLQANQSVGGTLALTAGSVNVGSSTLTHTGASVTRSSGTITTSSTGVFAVNSTSSYTLPAGTLTGSTLLTKNNTGSLTLNSQSHSGGVTLTAGTIVVAANDALGSGTFTINGGTVNTDATARSTTNAISIGGSFTFTGTNSLTQSTGAITLTATPTITASASTLTLGGVISGGFGITKAGAGTLTLSNTNTYTGATTINAGTLSVPTLANGGANSSIGASTNAAANLILGGGTLLYTGPNANTDRNFTLTASTTSTINTTNNLTISGASANTTGAITKAGAGTLILTGTNLHTGINTISAGTLQIGNGGTTGSVAGAIVKNANLIFDRSNDFTYAGNISGSSGTLTKRGAGILTLVPSSGSNTFTGGINIEGGTIRIGIFSTHLNIPNASNVLTLNGGNLQVGDGSTGLGGTVGSVALGFTVGANGGSYINSQNITSATPLTLSGAITNNSGGTLTLQNTTQTNSTFSGIISGNGSVVINNTGAGVTTFSGANTYTGTTTLTGGVLQLGAADRISNSSNLIFNGGTFRTGATTGFAETAGTLDVDANSTIALGSGNHTLTFANSSSVAWNSSATLTITGWTGTAGQSGSEGKIVVDAGGLTDDQLAQITFSGYCPGAMILGTELVPKGATLGAYSTQLSGNIEKGTTNAPIAGFTMNLPVSGNFTAITVTGATATASDLSNVRIFRDNNGNGLIDGADAVVSDALSFASSMVFTITGESNFSGTRSYLVVADISSTATAANVQVSITGGNFTAYCAAGNVGTVAQVTRPLVNSSASDIVRSSGFTEPTNILYTQYQSANIAGNGVGNGNIKIGEFTLRDGGGTSDLDGFGTTLTAISFTVSNPANLRRLALYDNTGNAFIGTEITSVTSPVSFSGLTITAADGGSRTFSIYASFNTTVTDNQQIGITVSSVTASSSGSGFAAANGGASATSTTGDANRIEVVADRLAFVQQPTNTVLDGTMSPAVTIQAADVHNNRDLDFTGSVTISSTGTLTGDPVVVSSVSGLASFAALVHTAEGIGLTLQATATSLTAITSNTFNITVATEPIVITGTVGTETETTAPINDNNVTSDGGSTITERGVVYSLGALPTILDSKLTSSGTTGIYSSTITGLTAGTIYYARAYATNGVGTGYGDVVIIRTPKTITFRDGLNDYGGTEDTYVRNTQATTSFGTSTIVEVDQDPQDHGLFRFSNIVGCGTNQIPQNAQITSATFSFNVIEPGEGTRVFRMNGNWTESSTWNTLVNGVEIGTETPSNPIITFGSSDGTSSDFVNGTYNVTGIASIVQEWVNGTAANNGFAIINFPLSNDGADIASSENGTATNRPSLTVTYRPVVSGEVYRTKSGVSGNWSDITKWEFAPTTSGPWTTACAFPSTSNSSEVIIQSNTNIVVDVSTSVDKLTVDGTLEISANQRLAVMNGQAGTDMTVNGTLLDRGSSNNGLQFENNSGTTNDASWLLGSSGSIIKTNQSSVQNYNDFYQGGMSTIPATANWTYRNNGDGTVATAAVGMFYPNLYFENTITGNNYAFNTLTSSLRGATGGYATVKGNMFVGTTGSGTVTLHNNNINSQPMLIQGNLSIGTGSTLTNASYDGNTSSGHGNGTGFEVQGNITVSGTGTFTNNAGSGVLRLTGINAQSISGTGTINLRDFTVNKSSETATLSRDITVDNQFDLQSGTLAVGTSTLTLNGAVSASSGMLSSSVSGTVVYNQSADNQTVLNANYGNLSFSNFAKTLPSSGSIGVAGTFTPGSGSGHTINGSTIDFNGSGAQTVPAFNYHHLTISGTRSSTALTLASGTVGIAGNFTASATGISSYITTGNTVDFNGTGSQTIGASFNFNNLTVSGNKNSGTITLGSGVIGVAGNFTTSGASNISYSVTGNTVDFNGTNQTIGEFTFNNLTTSNSGTKQFTGTGFSAPVSGTSANLLGTFTIGDNTTVLMNGYGMQVGQGGIVLVNGILDFNNTSNGFISRITGTGEVSTLTMGASGRIRTNNPNGLGVGASSSIRGNGAGTMTQTSVSQAGTVEYYGDAQAVNNRAGAGGYYNLILTGSGDKTLDGNTTVNGALTLSEGTLVVGTRTLTLNGAVSATNGTLSSAASGTVVYNQSTDGQTVLNANYGNLSFSNFAKTLPSSGSIGVAGTFTPGSGSGHTIAGSTINFNGSGAQTVPAFNYHHLTVSEARGNNPLTLGTGTIGVAGDFTTSATDVSSYVTTGNTVDFNGVAAQSIGAFNFNNLSISGNKNGGTITLGSGTIGIAGNFTASATGVSSYVATGNTVDFNGTTSQSISAFDFNNLRITGDKNNGTITLGSGTIRLSGDYTVSASDVGSFVTTGNTFEFSGTSSSNTMSATIPINFNHLVINKSGQTLNASGASTINVAGTITLAAGQFIPGPAGTINMTGGNWTNNGGTFTRGNSTLVFSGSGEQVIGGTTTAAQEFANITIDKQGGSLAIEANKEVKVNNNFSITAGTFAPGAGTTLEFDKSGQTQSVPLANYHSLKLSNGGIKTLADNTAVAGNLVVENPAVGTTEVTPGARIRFNGNSEQLLAGLPFRSVEISGGATKRFTGNASIVGAITFTGGSGTVDLDGEQNNLLFTVRSTADSTARIANVGNWTLSGKAVVERYVPAQRKWRLISVPTVPGETLRQALTRQINGTYPNPVCFTADAAAGSGTLLTGHSMSSCTNATSVGFDHLVSGGSSSIRFYNINASNRWASSSSTPNILAPPTESGYLVFIRGDRQATASGSNVTTLRPKGDLIQGNYNVEIKSQYFVLGNPYASPINFESVWTTNQDKILRKFWIWDANLSNSSNGVGGYRTFSHNGAPGGGEYTVSPPLEAGQGTTTDYLTINSSQAILVERNGTAQGNVVIQESHKEGQRGNLLTLRTGSADLVGKLQVDLVRANGTTSEGVMDGVVARFANWYDAEPTDIYDVYKHNQFEENLSISRKDKGGVMRYLSIESRPWPASTDTIFMPFYQMSNRSYGLKIKTENLSQTGMTAYLQDQFTGTETPIALDGSLMFYPFNVTADANSKALTRLRVVFRPSVITSAPDIFASKDISIYPNPVVKGQGLNLQFRNSGAGRYTVRVFDMLGVQVHTAVVVHAGGNGVQRVGLPEQLSAGTYFVELTDAKGQKGQQKVVVQ